MDVREWGIMWATSRYSNSSLFRSFKGFPSSSVLSSFVSSRFLTSALSNFRETTQRWWSRKRHSCRNFDTRLLVPIGVDCFEDNDVGVGCGVLTEEARTAWQKLTLRVHALGYYFQEDRRIERRMETKANWRGMKKLSIMYSANLSMATTASPFRIEFHSEKSRK